MCELLFDGHVKPWSGTQLTGQGIPQKRIFNLWSWYVSRDYELGVSTVVGGLISELREWNENVNGVNITEENQVHFHTWKPQRFVIQHYITFYIILDWRSGYKPLRKCMMNVPICETVGLPHARADWWITIWNLSDVFWSASVYSGWTQRFYVVTELCFRVRNLGDWVFQNIESPGLFNYQISQRIA